MPDPIDGERLDYIDSHQAGIADELTDSDLWRGGGDINREH